MRLFKKAKPPVEYAPAILASLVYAGLLTSRQEALFLQKWNEILTWNGYGRFHYDEYKEN
jgi:hypothetical protein